MVISFLKVHYLQETKFLDNMKIGFVKYVTEEVDKKTQFINEWNTSLNLFLSAKEYGFGVKSIVVGITCVSDEYLPFFKQKKASYIDYKRETHDDVTVEIEKTFEYGILLDFKVINDSTEEQILEYVATEFIKSLSKLESLPKKVKDFNTLNLINDINVYFKEKGIIR